MKRRIGLIMKNVDNSEICQPFVAADEAASGGDADVWDVPLCEVQS